MKNGLRWHAIACLLLLDSPPHRSPSAESSGHFSELHVNVVGLGGMQAVP